MDSTAICANLKPKSSTKFSQSFLMSKSNNNNNNINHSLSSSCATPMNQSHFSSSNIYATIGQMPNFLNAFGHHPQTIQQQQQVNQSLTGNQHLLAHGQHHQLMQLDNYQFAAAASLNRLPMTSSSLGGLMDGNREMMTSSYAINGARCSAAMTGVGSGASGDEISATNGGSSTYQQL